MSTKLIEDLCRCLAYHAVAVANTRLLMKPPSKEVDEQMGTAKRLITMAGFHFDKLTNGEPRARAVVSPPRRKGRVSPGDEIRPVSRLQSNEERQDQEALEAHGAKAVLHRYECAKAWRDSISRKLFGGSTLVTVDDLANSESSLSEAKKGWRRSFLARPFLSAMRSSPSWLPTARCGWPIDLDNDRPEIRGPWWAPSTSSTKSTEPSFSDFQTSCATIPAFVPVCCWARAVN